MGRMPLSSSSLSIYLVFLDFSCFLPYPPYSPLSPEGFYKHMGLRYYTYQQALSHSYQNYKASLSSYIGYCYGKKRTTGRGRPTIYRELAGQDFWAELTGDRDFYLKIIKLMGTQPEKYLEQYKASYAKASNRLIKQFTNDFCDDDGNISWDKLVKFNSGYTD